MRKALRKRLDKFFIESARWRVSNYFNYIEEGNKLLKGLRVCLVKQETFQDLYTNPEVRGKGLLFSTFHRSGPIGLFEAGSFDFFIIKVSQSEESRVWKYLKEDMDGPSEAQTLAIKDRLLQKDNGDLVNDRTQSELAVEMTSVDWSSYDLVVSINFSIDEHVIKKYSNILWCYMLQEPSMRHYVWSMNKPLYGYDLFLNQRFTYRLSHRPTHEVNFPYNFMNSTSFDRMVSMNSKERKGVFLEIHSVNNVAETHMNLLKQFGEIRFPKEELFEQVLYKMRDSKYFLSLRGRQLRFNIWGNSMIDAVGAGLLAFGNPDEYHNIGLFTPFTAIYSFEEFVEKVQLVEKNPARYFKELVLQRRLLNKYCFYKPLKEISDAHYKKQMD